MYKCCWNCENGFTVCTKTEEEAERINASKRMCCANYPISNRLQNPFQRRYCNQFVADYRPKKGHFISKTEAEKLNAMTTAELVKYWGERNRNDEK